MQRNFIIGSEWLYYKIYCGIKTSDIVLTQIIYSLTHQLLDEGLADRWFFIRYFDPEYHIRFRVHVSDLNKIGEVILKIENALRESIESGSIWKVQIDTYQREIERYGILNIVMSEHLFFIDSAFSIEALRHIQDDEMRWKFVIKVVDLFLDNFKHNLDDKESAFEKLKTKFGKEFGMHKSLKQQIDNKYRVYKNNIDNILFSKDKCLEFPDELYELLNKRNIALQPIANEILANYKNNQLDVELDYLIESYIHMCLNRFFRSKQRANEMVIYEFLWRAYRSGIARKKIRLNQH